MKQNTTTKITTYLKRRKTAATATEIANGIKANYNTVRKLLSFFTITGKRNGLTTYTYREKTNDNRTSDNVYQTK